MHRKTRLLERKGKKLLWAHLVQVHDAQRHKNIQAHTKLSYGSLHLTQTSCMRVSFPLSASI